MPGCSAAIQEKLSVMEAPEKVQKTKLATSHSKFLNNTFEDYQITPE